MDRLTTPNLLLAVICILTVFSSVAAAEYDIQSIRLTANVPVKISITGGPTLEQPQYKTTDGQWKSLPYEHEAATATFSAPPDALPATIILLDKPAWLQLPDDEAPTIVSASVDNRAVPVAETIMLGYLPATPQSIVITAADADNPIASSTVAVQVNGEDVDAFGGGVALNAEPDGKRLDIVIKPGQLDEAHHSILVSVADATPERNTTVMELTFTTAPLLTNGNFELAADDGRPQHWSTSTWSSDAETKAEFQVAEGGHSGSALRIQGIAGSLNMVCGQSVDLIPGADYVLSGYYKNDRNTGYVSVIGNKDGKQDQYSNMPTLKHAEDWTEFSWQFTADTDNSKFMLYLRASGVGTVWFDELKLEQVQP
jgi:hypothetical protein